MQRNITGYNTKKTKEVTQNFVGKYPGLIELKQNIIPTDAARGYFEGLDGRYVICNSVPTSWRKYNWK